MGEFGDFHNSLSGISLNLVRMIGEILLGLVVNPNAGGKVARAYFAAKDFFAKHKIEHTLISADNSEQCRQELIELAPSVIVAIGGDGTLHSLTGFAINHKIPVVLLPSGSGNDSARKFGLINKKPEQILSAGLIDKNFESIDVMSVKV
ncbi:MAG TPA: acylglycerol kinase family protein, partial [Microbacteriaceae bacterium]